nr:vitelline membrane outer layer protein 1 homolog [Cherax quadricarinatus]
MSTQCEAFNWAVNTSLNNCQLIQYPVAVSLVQDKGYDVYMDKEVAVPVRQNVYGVWGTWSQDMMCQAGSYVYGYSVWYDYYDGSSMTPDDCGVTGVMFLCRTQQETPSKNFSYKQLIAAGVQKDTVTCSVGNFIQDIKIRFAPPKGSKLDDDALNNVEFRCQDNTVLNSIGTVTDSSTGTWSNWTSCVPGTVLCGARVMYEALGQSDNTCCNEILMLCCFL